MAGEDMDRTEQATPYKLKKAREKGQVAKSLDFVSVVVFLTAVVFLYLRGPRVLEQQFLFDRALLSESGQTLMSEAAVWSLVHAITWHLAALLGPFFGAVMLSAVVANLVQTGPLLAFEQVKADLSRLNPMEGAKKVFSLRKLFDGFKASAKLALLALVAYFALRLVLAQFFQWGRFSPGVLMKSVVAEVASIGFKMALVLAVIAMIDMFYTKREYAKRMRMSRREIKDEIKNRDGDPRIRSRLRQLRQEMLKRSASTRNTEKADVLIVNPVHFAVALKYEHGKMESPQLLAKGSGAFAVAMRGIAAKHSIPIVQNVTLARKLFRELEVDQHVPPSMYADVARIIVWVFAMRKARDAYNGAGATSRTESA
ncbi:MAG: flagellar biosynthesis protein FlhB [Massilia sp.]